MQQIQQHQQQQQLQQQQQPPQQHEQVVPSVVAPPTSTPSASGPNEIKEKRGAQKESQVSEYDLLLINNHWNFFNFQTYFLCTVSAKIANIIGRVELKMKSNPNMCSWF